MKTILDIILLLVGFVLLIKGADYFVDGSCAVAKRLRVPSIVIGLTIVAVGTSLPELAVSTFAAVKHSNAIALGNVVGSNIFNLLMVIGITALFKDMLVKKSILKREMPLLLIISVLLIFLAGDILWFGGIIKKNNIFLFENGSTMVGNVNRIDGILLLVLFVGFIAWTVSYALKERTEEDGTDEVIMLSKRKSAIFIVGGAIAIAVGGQVVVDSAKSLALAAGMSETLVGLTIVAMGTSLPETAVSVTASLVDNNTLAISNVVGSNIFNLMFVIGVCSILSTIYVQRETVTRDIPFSIICALLLLGLGMIAVGDASGMTLGHFDGILFLILFAGYIGLMIKSAMKARAEGKEVEANDEFDAEELKVMSYPKSIIYIVGGAIAIAIGGDLTVDTASRIAIDLGMSQTLVGLTIVSIGTSLPELVTSVVAARKNEVDMAVGNAVGSNIFNILMVLGIASAINPVSLIRENVIDIIILVVFSVVVWIFAATKKKISRREGIAMVAMYLVYAVYIILR